MSAMTVSAIGIKTIKLVSTVQVSVHSVLQFFIPPCHKWLQIKEFNKKNLTKKCV